MQITSRKRKYQELSTGRPGYDILFFLSSCTGVCVEGMGPGQRVKGMNECDMQAGHSQGIQAAAVAATLELENPDGAVR